MDLISFLNQRKALTDAGDADGLAALETEAAEFAGQFLKGELAAEVETAPLFYSFFRTFAQTDDNNLKSDCERALEELRPLLDEFDKEHDLTHLDELDQNVIEYNLARLAVFERLNPFEKEKGNRIVRTTAAPEEDSLFRVVRASASRNLPEICSGQQRNGESILHWKVWPVLHLRRSRRSFRIWICI